VIWGCVKRYSVMNDLRLCENVFCNESSEFVTYYRIRVHTNSDHSLQNTFSYKLRSLITEYVFTQPQITMRELSLCENVICNEWSVFVWKRILWWVISVYVKTYSVIWLITEYFFTQTQTTHYRIRFHTNWDDSLQNMFSHKLRSLITEYVFT
jgi:hypothetical protein